MLQRGHCFPKGQQRRAAQLGFPGANGLIPVLCQEIHHLLPGIRLVGELVNLRRPEAGKQGGGQVRLLPDLPQGGLGLGLPGLHVALGKAVVAVRMPQDHEAGLPRLPGKDHGAGRMLQVFPQIPVDDPDRAALRSKGFRQTVSHADGTMLAAGAADRQHKGLLQGAVVGIVEGDALPEQGKCRFQIGLRLRRGEHMVPDLGIQTVPGPERLHPIGVRKPSGVEHRRGLRRLPVEKAEGHQGDFIHVASSVPHRRTSGSRRMPELPRTFS